MAMKKAFYFYSSNIKSLPKGLFIFIMLLLLVLIPLLLSLALIGGTLAIAATLIRTLLPGRRKPAIRHEGEVTVIDITPEKKHLK